MRESFFERLIINQQNLVAYATDTDTNEIIYMTQAAASLYGFEHVQDTYGKKCYELIQGLDSVCPFCTNSKLVPGQPYHWEHYNEKLQMWFDITDILVMYEGKYCRLEIARDVTAQKEKFDRVSNRLTVEETLVDCIQTLSSEADVNAAVNRFLEIIGRFYAADRAYIFEYRKNQIKNTFEWCAPNIKPQLDLLQEIPIEYIRDWNHKFELDGEFFITSLDRDLETDSPDYRILKDQGIESLAAAPLKKNGQIIGFLGVDNPIESTGDLSLLRSVCSFVLEEMERRRLIQNLELFSYTDLLTGLQNRNSYIKMLDRLSHQTLRSLGVIYIDINGMKKINDSNGHKYGDRVIKKVADILKSRVENSAYRVGGDEFTVICADIGKQDFQTLTEKLIRDFDRNKEYDVSIGHTWKEGNVSADEEILKADDLMYAEKQRYYHAVLQGDRMARAGIATELLRDIADHRFGVYYQPQICLKTGRIMGAEALVRKWSKRGTLILPDRFIPHYERERVICHLDLFVFETVCADWQNWKRQGIDTHISSNFSRVTLMASDIVTQIKQICRKYEVPAEKITIEVTESISKLDPQQLIDLMNQIVAEGFSVSLDDFGSKYSNLSILTTLDFNEIKFDKSLVDKLSSDAKSRIVMKNTMQICRELPMTRSLAEGIETVEQLDLLHQYHCDYGQGYYFAKPMSAESFLALLKKEQMLGTSVWIQSGHDGTDKME
ncbi:sensor domain-containing phosphodiesterase [Hungatella hathewayi]|uniref:sensor domain-containing phosphodiesterase n=1 Tax=Hungatella hathewayi TaxID=154046 RepID=UPI001D6EDBB9|nr:EAL domain-containing protein [Hungatella hathewayi]MBS6758758.1 EAL domain-containing protein [Hungatella hathewayi]